MSTAKETLSEALEGRGCLGKAARTGTGDMPVFVLIAQDATAPARIREWADAVELFYGKSTEKTREARLVALAMQQWQSDHQEMIKVPD